MQSEEDVAGPEQDESSFGLFYRPSELHSFGNDIPFYVAICVSDLTRTPTTLQNVEWERFLQDNPFSPQESAMTIAEVAQEIRRYRTLRVKTNEDATKIMHRGCLLWYLLATWEYTELCMYLHRWCVYGILRNKAMFLFDMVNTPNEPREILQAWTDILKRFGPR